MRRQEFCRQPLLRSATFAVVSGMLCSIEKYGIEAETQAILDPTTTGLLVWKMFGADQASVPRKLLVKLGLRISNRVGEQNAQSFGLRRRP